jgi:hypothetical protein
MSFSFQIMSERNGDRARYHKCRKRKLLHRQRIQALLARLRQPIDERRAYDADDASRVASLAMQDEGGPTRSGD